MTSNSSLDEPVFATPAPFQECHASTLVLLPNGDVVCAWFGGTIEGADDVAIWLALRHEEKWSPPRELVRHAGVPTWNPVLFMPDHTPRLLLYYRAGRKITAWQSYVLESQDGGQTWSDPQPLPDGFLGPIKNKPIVLSDGAWFAGSSVETDDEWFCRIERSDDQGRTWTVAADLKLADHPKGIIQPTVWESAIGNVHVFMRSRGVGRIVRADSNDGGRTWGAPYLTDLPNNNSGIDAAVLLPAPSAPGEDGKGFAPLALAYNPVTEGRTPLVISLSYDNGFRWTTPFIVADLASANADLPARALSAEGQTRVRRPGEFSYPALIATADGVAITYTCERKSIRFARYSLEQLQGADSAAVPSND